MKPNDMVNVDVILKDIVTPESCSLLVCEVLKHVLYQKEQIPYTFDRLKYLMTKRKELISRLTDDEEVEDNSHSLHSRLTAERHYNTAEEMYTNLECALENIRTELEQSINSIEEIVIVFGSTHLHAQNIVRIPIPVLTIGHKGESHPPRQHLITLFQAIVSSDELHESFRKKLSPTNAFIMLKLKNHKYPKSEKFLHREHYTLPTKTPVINFDIKEGEETDECDCLSDAIGIYCDTPSRHNNVVGDVVYAQPAALESEKPPEDKQPDDEINDWDNWFQFNTSLKGFKDFKVDGISVTNLWLKYKRPHSLTS